MLENSARTELSSLGEFGLIEALTANIKLYNAETLKGVGDDAAVIKNTENTNVVTTDLLLEGVHFDLSFFPLKHLGYKAVVVNLSDVYAMNAIPKQITVSLGISSKFSLEAIEELYAGILLACDNYNVDLVGGDTSSSKQGLVISVTAIGEAKQEDIVYRNGAKEFDLLCVSGDLGGAYTGFQLLEREKRVFLNNPGAQPDIDGYDYILERQLKPEARRDIIDMLQKLGIKPTSMIDISDGLASEIFHIAKHRMWG
jgi:thiamine-monophosphate kinase